MAGSRLQNLLVLLLSLSLAAPRLSSAAPLPESWDQLLELVQGLAASVKRDVFRAGPVSLRTLRGLREQMQSPWMAAPGGRLLPGTLHRGRILSEENNGKEETERLYCWEKDDMLRRPEGFSPDDQSLKFVAIGHLTEQLSKGRVHFAEAMMMARETGRVVVLPNVGNSEIGNPEFTLPFCTYFNTETVDKYVTWVSERYFLEEVLPKRQKELSTFTMFMTQGGSCEPAKHFGNYKTSRSSDNGDHYDQVLTESLRGGPHCCITCRNENSWEEVMRVTKEDARDSDVLVVVKDAYEGCLSPENVTAASQYMEYSASLKNQVMAMKHTEFPGGYIALQWRIEKMLQSRITAEEINACKDGLLRMARRKAAEYNINRFFLASDVSPMIGRAKSNSFGWFEWNSFSSTVMDGLREIYRDLDPLTWDSYKPSFSTIDSGLQGILDKVACTEATLFIYAPPECAGSGLKPQKSSSSYVREIIAARKAAGLLDETTMYWETDIASMQNGK